MASKINQNDSFSNRRFHLVILFLGALTIRLVYFIQSSDNPLLYTPILDETYYIHLGKTIAGGFWMGEDRLFFMDPLYGYFLGAIFYFFGDNLTTIRLVQILLDSFNVVLICMIGEKVWSRQAGVVAAVFYALYKVSFYYTLLILKTTGTITFSLLFTLALIGAAKKGRGIDWLLLGLLAGVLTYFRANLLLMAPLAVIAYWFVERPGFRKLVSNGAMLTAGLFAALSIGAFRNYMVSGEVVFLNTQTGRLLYSSNNPENLTGRYSVPSFSRRNAEDSETDFQKESERRLGRKLSAKEVSGYWVGQTIDFLRENRGVILTLLYNKIKGTMGDYEIPNNFSSYIAERFSSLAKKAPLPTFAFAFALGIPGLAIGLKRNRRVAWALAPLITSLVTILIFYTSSRFRILAVPSLLIGSGIFTVTVYGWMEKKEIYKAASLIVLSIALAVISLSASNPQPTGDGEYFLARAYWNIGDLGKASAVSGESAIRFPYDSRFKMLSGMIALSENRIEDAINRNLQALKVNPSDADAYHNLGLAYHAMGLNDKAVESLKKAYMVNPRPKSLYALARVYDQTGKSGIAIANYKRFLALSRPSAPLVNRATQRLKELSDQSMSLR